MSAFDFNDWNYKNNSKVSDFCLGMGSGIIGIAVVLLFLSLFILSMKDIQIVTAVALIGAGLVVIAGVVRLDLMRSEIERFNIPLQEIKEWIDSRE